MDQNSPEQEAFNTLLKRLYPKELLERLSTLAGKDVRLSSEHEERDTSGFLRLRVPVVAEKDVLGHYVISLERGTRNVVGVHYSGQNPRTGRQVILGAYGSRPDFSDLTKGL